MHHLNLILIYLNADIEYLIYEEDQMLEFTSKIIKNDVSFLGADLL